MPSVHFGSVTLSSQAVWVLLVTVIVVVALQGFFNRTLLGKAMKATAINRRVAAWMGIPVERMVAASFGLAALLGAVGGILIVDYFLIRRTKLDLPGLFERQSQYWYTDGFNIRALIALTVGIAPCAPGFLGTVTSIHVAPIWMSLYSYAWFISFGISGTIYGLLMAMMPTHQASAAC